MGALRKILRALLDDDGAPSIFSGLVAGSDHSDQPQQPVGRSDETPKEKTAPEPPASKRR